MNDPLREIHKGLGRKPTTTKRIRTGWCSFCRQTVQLKYIPKLGCLCPDCGGKAVGNHPGITRQLYRG